ncbi:MAG TPA: ATP-dependent protease ATPase subunit HslU [Planctomycetota bacterium]|nr:ATP-dependent protease ATPase subunit HslU [Planctomycetota bacterium]
MMTPREIVSELDKHIVGQSAAKRAVAIAIRNRWRRKQLPPELRDEVTPKNIIMIGPTGVGKTEIARRLAALVKAPFLKVEASKYTEVGYVGRDVESMIRDLVDSALNMVKLEMVRGVQTPAQAAAEDRLLDLLLPGTDTETHENADQATESRTSTREKFRQMLREGKLDEREVEISVERRSGGSIDVFSPQGIEHMGIDFASLFDKIGGGKKRVTRKMRVKDALEVIRAEEADKLVDLDKAKDEALLRVQQDGIIFLDEIDKIASRDGAKVGGPDVSREGVQRDLLPIVEGSTVQTRHGLVKTDHILFIAAGAFHVAKPSDLIPELQGRFPIRVELQPLGKEDFLRILTEPKSAMTKQYAALLSTEGVSVEWLPEALDEIADVARAVNERTQNIGARRLSTVLERLLEEELFFAPDRRGTKVVVDRAFVRERLAGIARDEDLSRYIL